MPVTVRKKDGYEVRTSGGVKAKNTTAENAVRQARLLNAVEHGFKPTGAPAKRPVTNAWRKAFLGSSSGVVKAARARTRRKAA